MLTRAYKGDYVQIGDTVLRPGERAPQVPEDTKKVPLEMRVKGFMENDSAQIGQEVMVKTVIGRSIRGILMAVNPRFTHDFAGPQPELLHIGSELKKILRTVKADEL